MNEQCKILKIHLYFTYLWCVDRVIHYNFICQHFSHRKNKKNKSLLQLIKPLQFVVYVYTDAHDSTSRHYGTQTDSLTYTQGHHGPLKARLRVNTIRHRLMESRQARDKCDFISTSLERLSVQIADEEMWFPSLVSSRILLHTLSVIPEHVFKAWP